MKKLFALVLAVLMICAMSVSVFAETKNVVGTHGEQDSYEDGAKEDEFAPDNFEETMEIKAAVGTVEHRYAVDIEYDELTFNVDGTNLVWNVNTLQYEAAGNAGNPQKNTYDVKVINYSDLPVLLTVNVVDDDIDDGAVVSSDFNNNKNNSTITLESAVGKVLDDTQSDYIMNSKSVNKFVVSITADSWSAVANYYTNYFAEHDAETKTMGTMTITVAKVPSSGT